MKLIYCPECGDVLSLTYTARSCSCGLAWGYYKNDGLNAIVGGGAVPLGFANDSFLAARVARPQRGWGSTFTAFVIPKDCPTVTEAYEDD